MVPNVFVQFGIHPNPAVTKAWSTAPIKDDPRKQSNTPGTLVFALGGPNTRTTQVFINFQDNSSQLDSMGFAPIGTVTEGFDVVKNLYGGYGEMKEIPQGGPDRASRLIASRGRLIWTRTFLSSIRLFRLPVIFPEPAPPAAKRAAPATTKK